MYWDVFNSIFVIQRCSTGPSPRLLCRPPRPPIAWQLLAQVKIVRRSAARPRGLCPHSPAMSWLRRMGAGAGGTAVGATQVGDGRSLQRRHTPLCDLPVSSRVEAGDFHNGSFLSKFATACAHKAVLKVGRPGFNMTLNWAAGGASGGMDAVAMDVMQSSFAAEKINVAFKAAIFCESDVRKAWCSDAQACQRWCSDVRKATKDRDGWCSEVRWTALKDLSKPKCQAHSATVPKACVVPSGCLDLLVGGFGSKDFPRLLAMIDLAPPEVTQQINNTV